MVALRALNCPQTPVNFTVIYNVNHIAYPSIYEEIASNRTVQYIAVTKLS
jgi:hypothetical protein